MALGAGLLLGMAAVVTPPPASAAVTSGSSCSRSGANVSCRYLYTGTEQTFVVPSGTNAVTVDAVGAASGSYGAQAAEVSGTLANLTAGQTLYVLVGGDGDTQGGFNGGGQRGFIGPTGYQRHHGFVGGGASDVRTVSSTATASLSSRLVVAGGSGAGGGGYSGAGGSAGQGGPAGFNTEASFPAGGGPGTVTAGGAGGAGSDGGTAGTSGALGQGGSGGNGNLGNGYPEDPNINYYGDGGGGGGGLYGGGGGGGTGGAQADGIGAGGGGGSSLVPAGGSGPTLTDAPASVTITYHADVEPTSLTLSSGNIQAASVGQQFAAPLVTQVTDVASGLPVAGATVTYDVADGPGTFNQGANETRASTDGSGTASASLFAGSTPGAITVYAIADGSTYPVRFTETVLSPDKLVVSPASASTTPGSGVTYSAQGQDRNGNPTGDLTAQTTFTIAPSSGGASASGASCTGAVCSAIAAGRYTVTGSDGSLRGSAVLTVVPGATARLQLAPASSSLPAGTGQSYTAQGSDQSGNSTGDVTAQTTFTIAPAPGSATASSVGAGCTGSSCSATAAGSYTVTGTDGAARGTASLSVLPGPATIVTAQSGSMQTTGPGQAFPAPLKAQVSDGFGNPVPGTPVVFTVTQGSASFSSGSTATVVADGSGVATAPTLTAGASAGPVTVTAAISSPGASAGTVFTETVVSAGPARADLKTSLSAPASLRPGGAGSVTVTVTNLGPSVSGKLLTAVYVPCSLGVTSTGGGTRYGSVVVFTSTGLAVNASQSYTVGVVAGRPCRCGSTVVAGAIAVTRDPSYANNVAANTVKLS